MPTQRYTTSPELVHCTTELPSRQLQGQTEGTVALGRSWSAAGQSNSDCCVVLPAVRFSLPVNNGFDAVLSRESVASLFVPPSDAPCCNTGCQSAEPLWEAPQSSGVSVDWVQFTVQCESQNTDREVSSLKVLLGDDWSVMEYPFYGYGSGVRCGGVVVLWDGHREDMGVHVQVTGSGCRELEARGLADWRGWFRDRFNAGAKFTRVDHAFDDRDGLLDLERMTTDFKAGLLVSRFNSFAPIQEFDGAGNLTADGFNLGKRAQDTSVCVYDKALEQRQKLRGSKTVDADAYAEKLKELEGHWVRLELRSRNVRADLLVGAIIQQGFTAVASVLRGYMEFKQSGTQSQKTRWGMAPWWFEFVGWAEKARLTVAPLVKQLEQSMAWLDRQGGAVLGMVAEALGDGFTRWVDGVARRGSLRMGLRHRTMLQSYEAGGGRRTALPQAR